MNFNKKQEFTAEEALEQIVEILNRYIISRRSNNREKVRVIVIKRDVPYHKRPEDFFS